MTSFGYTLFSELNGPAALIDQAQGAEEVGFDFAAISDHFHPWLDSHTDSPFAWSVLGAVADRTDRIGLATLVTCPTVRYHPAVIAQAAATIQTLSDGRFTLGLGAGERLNEHVVGAGWPSVDVRHEMLAEAVEIVQLLWSGGFQTYRGQYFTVEDARIYTLPKSAPDVMIAASGPASQDLAATRADGIIAVEPLADLVDGFKARGTGGTRTLGQVPCAYDRDEDKAKEFAMRFAFGVPGWKVMSELPNPVNFEAAVSTVRQDDVLEMVAYGSDPDRYTEAVRQFTDAGFEEIAVVQVGDDKEGFLHFWRDEVAPRLRGR